MKPSGSLALFAVAISAIAATITQDPTTVPAVPTVIIPSTSLVSGADNYCEKIDEHRCVNYTKVETCGYHHTWVFLRDCPLGCDKGDDITLCGSIESNALPPIPTTLAIASRANPDISNVRRNDGPCTPNSRACDSERRFLFICGDDGHWDEGRQCNRTNGCKVQGEDGLTCAGHPHFYYDDDRICERRRSCELIIYQYCLAVS
ncbi:hypothetical protein T440DRAFT_541018 [Plenodomus tracheiphilus IPT5]|uniref:ShKT domain-containing protein n=1 Tax=Plenodomus tracheiphilus IPT5 TaxID=1408161 RepID=A0A6A7AV16_9PLEO|nr:hypothetical protein T440DRAFT_541018 [Plenodomus tracheiphilus IPT5]